MNKNYWVALALAVLVGLAVALFPSPQFEPLPSLPSQTVAPSVSRPAKAPEINSAAEQSVTIDNEGKAEQSVTIDNEGKAEQSVTIDNEGKAEQSVTITPSATKALTK